MNQPQPNPSTMAAPSHLFSRSFTSCRRREQSPRPFTIWGTYITHTKRFHLTTCPILASSTSAQTSVFSDALDTHTKRLCVRCAVVVGKTQPCAATVSCNGATPAVIPEASSIRKGDAACPALPSRTTAAQEAATRQILSSGKPQPESVGHAPTPAQEAVAALLPTSTIPATGRQSSHQSPSTFHKPLTNLPSIIDILLTPHRAGDVHTTSLVQSLRARPSYRGVHFAMSILRSPVRRQKT